MSWVLFVARLWGVYWSVSQAGEGKNQILISSFLFVCLSYFRWLGRKETGTENPNYSLNTWLFTMTNCFGTELLSTLVV